MTEMDRPRGQTAGAGEPDIVGAQHLEHLGADPPHDQGQLEQAGDGQRLHLLRESLELRVVVLRQLCQHLAGSSLGLHTCLGQFGLQALHQAVQVRLQTLHLRCNGRHGGAADGVVQSGRGSLYLSLVLPSREGNALLPRLGELLCFQGR